MNTKSLPVITREYHFSAAHRIDGHPKCGRLHGHNYKVLVSVTTAVLDAEFDWVMDFSELDKVVNPIVDGLDHRYIVSQSNMSVNDVYLDAAFNAGYHDDYVKMPYKQSTAESISAWLFSAIGSTLPEPIEIVEVKLWETHRSCAVTSR